MGVPEKVIQAIPWQANVSTTANYYYIKTVISIANREKAGRSAE
jgi:hypothetical protein